MRGNSKKLIICLLLIAFTVSCRKDFLNVAPEGYLNQQLLESDKGIEALLVGAYSLLDGGSDQYGWASSAANWLYGSVSGMEANKGTDSGSQDDIGEVQMYVVSPKFSFLNVKWSEVYEAIARCNSVISIADLALKDGKITEPDYLLYIRQAKALRGWYHFEAWRMWRDVPYVDEKTDLTLVTNKDDNRAKILNDLSEGISLPDNMGAIGKFNGTVVKVLTAKALMQMYDDYASALPLLLDASHGTKPNGGSIGLAPTYGEIFDIVNRNGIEAVYTVQYSVNDGSGGMNGGAGEVLNFPYKTGASPAGCCGFFQPTQEFVNSFRTVGGLPLLDYSYNTGANQLLRDEGVPAAAEWNPSRVYFQGESCTAYNPGQPYIDLSFRSLISSNININPLTSPSSWELVWTEDNSKPVDPRLDWSVGRRGIPYWDWGIHTGSDWIRDQSFAGPYSPKKQVYKKSDEGKYTEVGNWTSGYTANGYRMIRFADVLLMIAECQIETGDLNGALININLVRNRAANPDGFVKEADGITPAATYDVKPYLSFPDRNYARNALRMERKLELGMEGHRWFDLNRWGITEEELNRALAYEETMPWGRAAYRSATVGPEDNLYPIPQDQIDLSNGKLVQNR